MFGVEHRIADAGLAPDARHHFGGIGHLRHPLGRHERRRLDRGEARVGQQVDQRDLDVGRHHRLLVLQAVARADLDQADPSWAVSPSIASLVRATTPVTGSPRSICAILPATCATAAPGTVRPEMCGVTRSPAGARTDGPAAAAPRGTRRALRRTSLPPSSSATRSSSTSAVPRPMLTTCAPSASRDSVRAVEDAVGRRRRRQHGDEKVEPVEKRVEPAVAREDRHTVHFLSVRENPRTAKPCAASAAPPGMPMTPRPIRRAVPSPASAASCCSQRTSRCCARVDIDALQETQRGREHVADHLFRHARVLEPDHRHVARQVGHRQQVARRPRSA